MSMANHIYLDNAATTMVHPLVAKAAAEAMLDCPGNPSSMHGLGLEARLRLERSARTIGETLGAKGENIIFTSGGTEADNLSIIGGTLAKRRRGNKIVTTGVEHSAVLASAKHLETMGFEVVYIPPNSKGEIDPAAFIDALDEDTIMVSAMAVNNEVGSLLPVGEIAKAARRKCPNALIHCDAVGGYGKLPIRVGTSLDVDLLSISGHKLHAPKGIGALYIKKGVRILPQSYGGSQGNGLRTGTEPLPLAVAFAKAAELSFSNMEQNTALYKKLHGYLTENLTQIEGICINSPAFGAPFIVNASVIGIRSEIMLHFLEERGIYLSSGSACSKGHKSHVLTAMNLEPAVIDSALRISFCSSTTTDQLDTLIAAIKAGTTQIRR